MDRTKKWRKILAMMLTIVMMLQNAQSVMVFADVTNEQIEQRLAGGQTQTEQQQPDQSQVETRASGEEYKTQPQESTDNGNDGVDIGSPETSSATTEAKTSNADVSAKITQSVFQADVSGVTCNFVQMTAEITNNDPENAATGVNIKALLLSSQLSYVKDYGTLTSDVEAYVPDSNNTSDLPDGSADGYDQIVMWTNQTIGAGETVAYQFAAQLNAENLDGVVDAWYVDGTSCNYTWENTEVLNPVQTPEADQEETPSDTTQDSNQSSNQDSNQDSTQEATPTPEVTEETTATPTPEVTEESTSEATETPEAEPTQAADDKKAKAAKKKNQQRLLAQRDMEDETDVQEGEDDLPVTDGSNAVSTDKSNIMCTGNTVTVLLNINDKKVDTTKDITVGRNDRISLYIEYKYNEDNKPKAKKYNNGVLDNIRYYDLPAQGWSYSNTYGPIRNGNDTVGRYDIINENGKVRVKLTYEETFLEDYPKEIEGTFTLRMQVDKNYVADSDSTTIDFPGLKKTVTLKPSDLTGEKDFEKDASGNPILDSNGLLTYYITLRPASGNVKNITVTDKLTGSFDYVDESFELVRVEKNDERSLGNISANIDHELKKATVTIDRLEYGENVSYKIKYKIKPQDGIREFEISNAASWSWGEEGNKGSGSSSAPEIDLRNETLTKKGVVDDDNIITYTVEINKIGAMLLPEGTTNGKLILTDKIPDNVTWLGDVKITGGTKPGWSYDDKTRILTVAIDDGTPATLVYKVMVNGTPGTPVPSVVNTISLKGTNISSKEENKNIEIKHASATAKGKNGTLTIVKRGLYSVEVNGKTEQPKLKDAVFQLYKVELEGENLKETCMFTEKSDKNGKIVFGDANDTQNQIQKDVLYFYVETQAPTTTAPSGSERYVIDSTKHYFIYKEKGLTENLQNAINQAGITYTVLNDGTILDPVTNDTEPTAISVPFSATKKLDDQLAEVSFEFNLMLKSYSPKQNGFVTSAYNAADNKEASVSDVANADADALKIENGNVTGGYNETVNAAGIINFPKANFKYEGTYTFVMRELSGNGNYIYDKSEKEIEVCIERDTTGKLTYRMKNNPQNIITFNNYTFTDLSLIKNTQENVRQDTEFTFQLTGEWNNQTYDFSNVKVDGKPISVENNVATVKVKVNKGKNNGTINLTGLPKNAKIIVKETQLPTGWHLESYSPADADDSGRALIILAGDSTSNKITVCNEYKEREDVTFKVNKDFNDWREGSVFKFKLQGLSMEGEAADKLTSIPMPASANGNEVEVTVSNSSTGNGDVKGVEFGNVSYTVNGDYYYMIKESDIPTSGQEKGITYDSTVTYIQVRVENGVGGKKKITVYTSGKTAEVNNETYKTRTKQLMTGLTATATFKNVYAAETQVRFKGTKAIDGRTLTSADKFTFKVSCKALNYSAEKQNVGPDINFDPITFTQDNLKGKNEETFIFDINEQEPQTGKINGIKYDKEHYKVQVKVTKASDGSLTATVESLTATVKDVQPDKNGVYILPNKSGKQATFVNRYGASAEIAFTATKGLSNKTLTGNDFTFKITGDAELTAKNGADSNSSDKHKIEFPAITYSLDQLTDTIDGKKGKIFSYTIAEDRSQTTKNKLNGVTYDETTYPITVTVTDNGDGTLSKVVKYNEQVINPTADGKYILPVPDGKEYNFENTYDASTSIKFVGNKTLENKALQANQFTFELTGPKVPGSTGSETKENDADGNFEFSTISYNLDDLTPTGDGYTKKDFEYTIAEKNDGQKGITYDKTTSYKIIVTVENDTTTGQLKPTAKAGTTVLNSTQDAATGTWTFTLPKQKNTATFINTYGATTEIQLAATKELKNKELEAGKYSFEIQQTNNESGFADANPATILSETGTLGIFATVKNGAEGGDAKDIRFPTLQYKITDLKKSDGTYAEDRIFHYTISEENGTEGGVTYSEQKYYVDVKVTDNGDGTFAKEVKVSTESSVSFDEKQPLTENNGVYSITPSDKYSFTNIYKASTKVQLTGIKKLVNDDAKKTGRKLKDVSNGTSSFKFEITGPNLKDEEGNAVKSRTVEIKTENKDSETAVFEFPEITYDITDLKGKSSEDFSYNIVEIAPKEKKGITYDTKTKYTAIVTITDNKNGTLSSSVKLQKNGTEENTSVTGNMKNNVAVYALTGSEATFTNRYNASGSYDFKVNKTLAGRKFQNGDNFKFQIVKTDGNKDEVIGTLKLTADENTSVGKLTGTIAEEQYGLSDVGKTYKYSIQELNPDKKMNGVTVSDQRYIIYVEVTDNNDGTLKTDAEWRREVNGEIQNITFDDPDEAITEFQNVYEADGTAQIVAQKTLSPLKLADNNNQFSFTLTRVDNTGKALTGKDAYEETIFNHGSDIIFTPLSYNQDDVGKDFYYTVKENKGTEEGYTYSEDVYNVHVTVGIDKQDSHKLITTKVITDASGATQDAIVFANTYKSTTSVAFEGKKEIVDNTGKALENITLEAGAFTFTVTENGTTVATGKNEADGTITFTPIEYEYSKDSNPLGEHTYIITEDQPATGDKYIYDHSSRTVVVNVTDDGAGNLSAAVVTDKSDAMSSDEKCFKNEVISLKFRKTDLTKKDEESTKNLKDATLRLSEYDTAAKQPGTTIAEWTTTDTDYTVSDGLVAGNTYILEEIAVPTGYTTADPIIFTIKNDETRSIEILSESGQLDTTGKTVIMSDAKTGVTVLKVDNDGKGVSGAELAILDGETVVEQWISDGQAKYIEGLAVGKEYILRELSAPEGYRKAADVKFTVEDGKNTSVKMVDSQTTASILKVDEEGNVLSGVILEVRDKDSNTLIDRWETDGKAHTISGLTEGVTYILSEISAPAGYTLAKPQEFTLSTTDSVTEIKIENKQNAVTISKKALTGTDSIGGAVLRVLDATGKEVVPKWTTEAGKDKIVTGVLKPNVTYTLEEVSAPSGYAKADNITFAVDESGVLYVNHEKATSVVMRDAKLRLCVSKTDITGKAELPGAVLQIIEKDSKKVVDEWTTTSTPHYTETGLVSGKTYLLHEKTAPAGYGYAEDVEFTLRNDSVVGSEQKVTMYDAPNTVVVTKTDLSGTKELAGAKLQILDTGGKVLESWTSSTEEHRVEVTLEAGKQYILHEVEAPEGYVLAEDVKFTVNKDGSTTRVVMKDAPTGVNISKTDLTGSKEIAGAVLQVLDKDGATVEQWTSDGTIHTVANKLTAGEKYTLHEVSAPAGYRTAKDIEFTVDKTGKTTKVVMKDAPTKASILKTDESGKALSGAQLVVKDSTGKELDKWTSDGKAHEITGLLTVGETYTLSEVSAPSGYTVAPDQTFKMEDKDVIEVTMVDYQASGSGQITVTKKVTFANGGDFIDLIAQDDTFYVNLFTDAAGKYPYKGALPQAIHLVNASAGSVTFSDLAQGTYYVYETDANGNVINLDQQSMHNGSQFMCTVDGGSNTVKLDLKAGPKEGAVNLENVFFDIPTGYSYKGEININKQVLKGTTQTTTDDTFYAGIFTKGDDGVYNLFMVVPLVQNDTVTVEVPLGGEDGTEPINYYILETDADGNILDLDVFEYEVTGEGTVALSKENLTGNINLVNKIPEESDGKLRVQKTDGNGVGLAGASFRLTDEDGTVVDEWTSEASAHELELEPGTYTLTEVQAPTGYTGAGSVTIEVDDDYNFSVNGEIEYSYNNGLLKIVNKVVPSDSTTPGTSGGGGSTPASYSAALSGKVAVKTGDNTPIGAYAAVLVIAALAIAGGIYYKKKRKNSK